MKIRKLIHNRRQKIRELNPEGFPNKRNFKRNLAEYFEKNKRN